MDTFGHSFTLPFGYSNGYSNGCPNDFKFRCAIFNIKMDVQVDIKLESKWMSKLILINLDIYLLLRYPIFGYPNGLKLCPIG